MNDIYSAFKDKYPDYTIEIFRPAYLKTEKNNIKLKLCKQLQDCMKIIVCMLTTKLKNSFLRGNNYED